MIVNTPKSDEVDWYHGGVDYSLLDVQGAGILNMSTSDCGVDLTVLTIVSTADGGCMISGIHISEPRMKDDPNDAIKVDPEARLPWWFWPLSLVVAVALAAAWAWSHGWEE